jgi:hypothetical protein
MESNNANRSAGLEPADASSTSNNFPESGESFEELLDQAHRALDRAHVEAGAACWQQVKEEIIRASGFLLAIGERLRRGESLHGKDSAQA